MRVMSCECGMLRHARFPQTDRVAESARASPFESTNSCPRIARQKPRLADQLERAIDSIAAKHRRRVRGGSPKADFKALSDDGNRIRAPKGRITYSALTLPACSMTLTPKA